MRRRAFLGAGAAGALALAGCGGSSGTSGAVRLPGSPDDAAVLAFLLSLEQLQLDLYHRAQSLPFLPVGDQGLLSSLAEQEGEHVARLTGDLRRLRGRVPRAPALKAPVTDRPGYFALAYRLENLTAAAFLGQVHRIQDAGVLKTVLETQTVEGRHAAAVGAMIGKTATPDGAEAKPADMATVGRVLAEVAV